MTGLEALKNMCENCERHLNAHSQICPFRSISNEYCDEYEIINKNLDLSDIFKFLLEDSGFQKKCIRIFKYKRFK